MTGAYDFPGSKWWRFDFHTHTPASTDYKGSRSISPKEWLDAYRAKGIQCVVVTDHNSGAWIDRLKSELDVLKNSDTSTWGGITIFPGIELSCNAGVHMLAILDPSKGTADIEAIRGRVGYGGTAGDSDGVTSQSIEQVIDAIHAAGGVACAAHVDQPKGLLISIQDYNTLQPIFNKLDSIELIDPNAPCLQNHATALENLASVLGSDSHRPVDVGRSFTWVKMSTPSIEGLRLALFDPGSAIRRGEHCPSYPQQLAHPKVKSITIENLRLRQQSPLKLEFNPSYNALIGGRGSGKSTILECIRLGLARDVELLNADDSAVKSSFENFKRQKTGRNQPGMMLPNTRLTVEVAKGELDLEERFEYIWSKGSGVDGKFLVSVRRWDGAAWQPTELSEDQARDFFPVRIFSQKQILSLADSPRHLIQYVDDALGEKKSIWEREFSEKRDALLAARRRLRALEVATAQKPAVELQFSEASRKAKVFASSQFGDALNAYQRARKQQKAVADFFEQIEEGVRSLQTSVEKLTGLKTASPTGFEATTPNEQAELQTLIALRQRVTAGLDEAATLFETLASELSIAKTSSEASEWHRDIKCDLDNYLRIVDEFKAQGITSAEEASTIVALEESLKKQLDQFIASESELKEARVALSQAQEALNDRRAGLTSLRQAFLNQVLASLPRVKITLSPMADTEGAERTLREILRLESEGSFANDIYSESDDDPPIPCGIVWDLVDPGSQSSVQERLTKLKESLEGMKDEVLNTKLHGKFVKRLRDMKPEQMLIILDELSVWFPEDAIELQFRRDDSASFQSLRQASAGQKTATILSFLLAHGNEPLLMDQPEDDLDNALVSELVVTQLRANKTRRQLIIISHNANIVVNGDADLVMPMEFIGGQIVNNISGGLQERSVRKKICEIMEGGEAAFEQRYKRILKDMRPRT